MIRFVPTLAAAAATGCTNDAPPANVTGIRGQLDVIAARCGLPARVFQLSGPEDLHFKPDADARYQDVDCALAALKKAKLPLKVAFVGNEAFVPENGQ